MWEWNCEVVPYVTYVSIYDYFLFVLGTLFKRGVGNKHLLLPLSRQLSLLQSSPLSNPSLNFSTVFVSQIILLLHLSVNHH